MHRTILLAAACAFFANSANAHDYTIGDIIIAHPVMYATTPVSRTTSGYLTLTNNGSAADTLLEVRADFPRVELHTTEMSEGVARMIRQDGLTIGAGETVALSHGGYHVMVMGLGAQLNEGDKIPATLVFEKAGTVDIVFNVEARTSGAADHAPHDAQAMPHGNGHSRHGAAGN